MSRPADPAALRWRISTVCLLLAIAALATFMVASHRASKPEASQKQLRVALFVNGTLGDKSFYDSAAKGLKRAHASLGIRDRVIEAGFDPSRWEAALADLVEGQEFDIIVTGTFTMVPIVEKLAAQFPASRFVVFDAAVDYSRCSCANVYSVLFRQNEGAYLAGFLATRLARPMTAAGASPVLAVVGGMQIPVIDDFIVGFTAGAKAADAKARVMQQYANSFTDPAAGKEIAKAMLGKDGASVIFHAAGATGQGVMEAAAEARRYVIGVDTDQFALYQASNPQLAAYIASSVVKNVDIAIARAIALHHAQGLQYGSKESLGLAEQGIGLAWRSAVLDRAPAELTQELEAVQARIISGDLKVPTARKSGGA